MQLEAAKYLWDLQQAAIAIQSFAAGRQVEDYESDLMLRSAIERQFTIAGEATVRLVRIDDELAGRISHCRSIVGLRNVVVHDYDGLKAGAIWPIIEEYLPLLISEVTALLEEAP